jgi:hypothetical protein
MLVKSESSGWPSVIPKPVKVVGLPDTSVAQSILEPSKETFALSRASASVPLVKSVALRVARSARLDPVLLTRAQLNVPVPLALTPVIVVFELVAVQNAESTTSSPLSR